MRFLFVAAAASIAVSSPATAAIINAPVPTNAYITFGGLDWAWASPCDASGPLSCGPIDMSYQSTQGWRIATAADFIATGITHTQFLTPGGNVPFGGADPASGATFFGAPSRGACATPWFSNSYVQCNFNDAANGFIWNRPGNTIQGQGTSETWVVREANGGAVPEPASWAMLIAGFGLVGAMQRRRKAALAA